MKQIRLYFALILFTICFGKQSQPSNNKFLIEISHAGPNNQYMGMKEALVMSFITERKFALPNFWVHQQQTFGKEDLRDFGTTFDLNEAQKIGNVISIDDFRRECDGIIDLIVWQKKPDSDPEFKINLRSYLKHHNLKNHSQILLPEFSNSSLTYNSIEQLASVLKSYDYAKCIAIAFPYKTLNFDYESFGNPSKYLTHPPSIKFLTNKVFDEIGVKPEELVAFHWRFAEDSCVEFPATGDFDFCFGTTTFHYSVVESVIYALANKIKQINKNSNTKISTIYFAIASHFEPPNVYNKIEKGLQKDGLRLVRASQLKSLDIKDNYDLSLVEQELCQRVKVFIASSDSSWSQMVVDYREYNHNVENSSREVYFLHDMLEENKAPHAIFELKDERNKRSIM